MKSVENMESVETTLDADLANTCDGLINQNSIIIQDETIELYNEQVDDEELNEFFEPDEADISFGSEEISQETMDAVEIEQPEPPECPPDVKPYNNNDIDGRPHSKNEDPISDNSLRCNTCRKTFMDLRRLKRHSKVHQTKKPHVCKECGKGFNERSDLTRHSARHTKLKANELSKQHTHKCPNCEMGFSFQRDLEIHSSIHANTGVFSCVECEKVFPSECLIS